MFKYGTATHNTAWHGTVTPLSIAQSSKNGSSHFCTCADIDAHFAGRFLGVRHRAARHNSAQSCISLRFASHCTALHICYMRVCVYPYKIISTSPAVVPGSPGSQTHAPRNLALARLRPLSGAVGSMLPKHPPQYNAVHCAKKTRDSKYSHTCVNIPIFQHSISAKTLLADPGSCSRLGAQRETPRMRDCTISFSLISLISWTATLSRVFAIRQGFIRPTYSPYRCLIEAL